MDTRSLFNKSLFVMAILAITSILFAQENWIVPTDDCHSQIDMRDNSGADDAHNEWRLRIRSDDDSYARDAYLKFSLDGTNYSFPEDVKVAFLKLTIDRLYNQREGDGYYCNFWIFGVEDNSWNEETLTWNNAPWSKENTGPVITALNDTSARIAGDDPVKPVVFNVTKYIKDQLTQGNTTLSLVLSDTTYGTSWFNGTDIRIYSKDCLDPVIGAGAEKNPDESFFPYLVVNENPMWVGYDRIPAIEDCYTEKRADTGEGASDTHNSWRVWVRSDDDKHARITYLKFSLEGSSYSFPEDVGSAYLNLTIDRLYNYSGQYSMFSVYDVGDNSWSEETLTWDNAPWTKENAGEALGTFTGPMEKIVSADPIYPVWFDITDYVRDQLNQGNTAFSLALCDTSYWQPWANLADIRFFSKDCMDPVIGAGAEKDPDESYFPCLYVKGAEGTSVENQVAAVVSSFALHQNYPNPFNPDTRIAYEIPQNEFVDLAVYNLLGQKVKDLLHEKKMTGHYNITWDGTNNAGEKMPAGVYVAKLAADNQSRTIKMVLVR